MICDTLLQVFKNTSFEDMVEIYVREDENIDTYYYQADAHRAIKSDFYQIGVMLFGVSRHRFANCNLAIRRTKGPHTPLCVPSFSFLARPVRCRSHVCYRVGRRRTEIRVTASALLTEADVHLHTKSAPRVCLTREAEWRSRAPIKGARFFLSRI